MVMDDVATLRQELTQLKKDLQVFKDTAEIDGLLDRYVVCADMLRKDQFTEAWARSTFTDDVLLEYPPGNHEGIEGIAEFHARVMDMFEKTWHLTSNHIIALDGDQARVRMTLLATHVHLATTRVARGEDTRLTAYDHYQGTVVRTDAGWRIKHLRMSVLAIDGKPPLGVQVNV